ncbi:MAG: shikimate kinase, partial [Chloroflexota bacterium]
MPDAIVLVGLSGSGKSSVGRVVAQRLDRPFIDLDDDIEQREGASPASLITEHGEAHFRTLETAAVQRACAIGSAVIATGGGAVIEPLNRWALWHAGTVLWLDAEADRLLARLATDAVERPLLGGDAVTALADLR